MKNIKNKISIKQILFLMFVVGCQQNSLKANSELQNFQQQQPQILPPIYRGTKLEHQQERRSFAEQYETQRLQVQQERIITDNNLRIDALNQMLQVGFVDRHVQEEINHYRAMSEAIRALTIWRLTLENMDRLKEAVERFNNRYILIEQAFFEYQQEKRRAKVFGFLGGAAVSSFLSIVFFEQFSVFSKLAFIGATSAVTTFFSKKCAEQRCLARPIVFRPEIQYQPLVFQ